MIRARFLLAAALLAPALAWGQSAQYGPPGLSPTGGTLLGTVTFGSFSEPSWTTGGGIFSSGNPTLTDTTGTGTVNNRAMASYLASTFASSNAVTVTNAATLFIGAPPNAGTNTTFTNKWSLLVSGPVLISQATTQTGAEIDVNQALDTVTLGTGLAGPVVNLQGSITTSGSASTAAGGHMVPIKGTTFHNGTGTLGKAYGVEGSVQTLTTGTITIGSGIFSYFQGTAAGSTITNYYAFEAGSSLLNSGTIGTWADFHSQNIGTNGAGTMGTEYTLLNEDPNKILQTAGSVVIGTLTSATAAAGELAFAKISASGSAPGAGFLKIAAVAGTNAGTCKIIAYAGTSLTPTTVLDNVGAGC